MRVLVVGAAVSGRAALALLEAEGHEVSVYDADPGAAAAMGEGRRTFSGEWSSAALEGVEVAVVSPGVPEHAPPIQAALAAGIRVWGEIELAAQRISAPLVAITATNGKTTITDLATAMLQESGLRTAAVGNIGVPLTDAVGGDWDVLVVEASSFQLRFIETFHPRAAVLLNVAPDHLDWHGSFQAYMAAKSRIFENQGPGDLLVFDGDDDGARRAVLGARSHLMEVSGSRLPAGGAGPEDGLLRLGDLVIDLGELAVSDPAFLVDAAAAGMAALEVGGTAEGVAGALRRFRPGRHRREVVGTWNGVTWIDDSKATNPHAAIAAIKAYPSVILIAGGRNKGLEVDAISGQPNLRHLIGIGEAGPGMVSAAAAGTAVDDLEAAVALADRLARPGDTVLLAPGCASFDMFHSYAHRGDVFAESVRRRKET
jgi:UDP-N-acetylmuramoylalanine--D-glutamate ligase